MTIHTTPSPTTGDLIAHIDTLIRISEIAAAQDDWTLAYKMIFSDQGIRRLYRELMDPLRISFDYYDPDTSYQADVEALVSALKELKERLPAELPADAWPARPARELVAQIDALIALSHRAEATGEWEEVYDAIFSDEGSGRVRALLGPLNLELAYVDPDMDYRDDVLAYVRALEELRERIKPFANLA